MGKLFDVQPEWCRQPLPHKEIQAPFDKYFQEDVLYYDPTQLYTEIEDRINPFSRRQGRVGMETIAPVQDDNLCDCGCGVPLPKGKRRWASVECRLFVWHIAAIITGDRDLIKRYITRYYEVDGCMECGITSRQALEESDKHRKGMARYNDPIEIDHTHPVHLGGGGSWLSNYKALCFMCHKEKSAEEARLRSSK